MNVILLFTFAVMLISAFFSNDSNGNDKNNKDDK